MQKKLFSITLLLLFSSLWVMAQQYEYWLDNDYNHRTTHSVGTGGESFEVDVSQLQPGIHYLNIRARETSEWGAISRYMIYLVDNPVVDSGVSTEYWFDNDYANRHVVEAGSGQISINQDLSSMQPGIHYFNVRTQGQSGQWGAVSRHMLYIYDQPVEKDVTSINYWIDQDSEHQQAVALDNGKAIISIDLNLLAAGEHVLCLRGMTANEPSGMLSTSKFKIGIEDILPWGSEQPWESKYFLTEGRSNYVEPSEDANGHKWTELEYDDSAWQTLTGPMADASDRFNEVNYIWEGDDNCVNLRRVFTMDSIPDGNYQLLMAHDDGVKVYLNGQLVVDDDTWGTDYTYDIPQSAFVLGKNILAIYIEEDSGSQYLDYCLRYVEPEHHPEPYAVLSENNTVLTFYYDEKKTERNGIAIGSYGPGNYEPWYENRTTLTTAVFDESFANDTTLTSTAYWFYECIKLTEIKGLEYLKTDKVTDMRNMFYGCSKLTTLDVSHLKTDNVTNMKLMFYYCSGLTSLDVTGFNTENVTDMGSMFNNCSGLTSLDISSFKTEKVKDMIQMFYQCYNLTTIYAGNSWSTASVTADYGYHMFTDCTALVGGKGTTYDANHVDYTYAHIDGDPDNPGYFTDKNASDLKDGDTFTAVNSDGVELRYMVISAANKTCQVGDKPDDYIISSKDVAAAVDTSYVGIIRIPEEAKGYRVVRVGFEAFYNCSHVTLIEMPNSVSMVTLAAFENSGITEITVPSSVTYFDGHSLGGCKNLESIVVDSQNPVYDSRNGCNAIIMTSSNTLVRGCATTKLAEKDGIVAIGAGAFLGCRGQEWSMVLPNTIISIETQAFNSCDLTAITLPSSLQTIGSYVFSGSKILSLVVPASVTAIGKGSFHTSTMTSLVVDEGNATFDSRDNCNAVIETATNKLVCGISTSVIPEGVTTIGTYAFDELSNLKSVTLPASITNIEDRAFWCSGLKSIISLIENPFNISEMTFDTNIYNSCELRVPVGTSDVYRSTPYWSHFTNIVELVPAIEATFDSNGVLAVNGSTTMADALSAAGGRAEVAKTIAAIVWNSTATLTNDDLQGLDNPNMLIYVKDAALAPANRDNVVIGGLAKNIVLADVESGNNNFYCPQEFTAEMISYTHEYRQQTEIGVSRGWETIALPFTVQTIMHEKNGLIAPFGNDASGKHFWLRQLSENGLKSATFIEGNTPYLISMPNSDDYPAEFIQAGRVTFSAQDAVVPVTQLNGMEAPTATGGMIMFLPCFQSQSADEQVYALNVDEQRDGYPEGSIFVANYRTVRPFEAFTVHHGDGPAPRFVPIKELNGGTTGIEDVEHETLNVERWYDLNGRRLQQKPTRKGVYILNGHKTVIK